MELPTTESIMEESAMEAAFREYQQRGPRPKVTADEFKDAVAVLAELERGQDPFASMQRTVSLETLVKRAKGKTLKGDPEAYRLLGEPPSLPDSKRMVARFQFVFEAPGTTLCFKEKPKENAIKNLFSSVPNCRPVASVQRTAGLDGVGADPYRKPSADGIEGLVSYQLTTVSHTKAQDIAQKLIALPWTLFSPQQISESWSWVHAAGQWQATNGPLVGLFTRLIAGLRRPKIRRLSCEEGSELRAGVAALMPIDVSRCTVLAGKDLKDLQVVMNWKSSSGMPWNKPKKEVIPAAFAVAKKILLAISEGTFPKLAGEQKQWFLVELKNKLDLYQYAETKDSIRSYFVYPMHLTWLFSAVMQSLSKGYLTFIEDPNSMNAHGFSWNYGGANALYEWVARACDPRSPCVRGIAYSDDQLWTVRVRTEDGSERVLVFAIDYKRMDLSLSSVIGRAYYQMERERFKAIFDKTWDSVFQLNCKMAFECMVIVCYSLVYFTTDILHSGVPGTPEFDQFASCLCFYRVRQHLGDTTKLTEAEVMLKLDSALAEVEREFGLSVKPETKKPFVFEPGRPAYEWTFLGKTLRRVGCYRAGVPATCYVPCSDPVKAVASITSPRSALKGLALVSAQMTRARDIVASGGFMHPQLYHAVSTWYATMVAAGNRARDPLEGGDGEFDVHDLKQISLPDWPGDKFPTISEILQLYLPVGVVPTEDAVPIGRLPKAQAVEASNVVGEDELVKLFGEDWGGQSLMAEDERTGKDVGGVTVPTTSSVKVRDQGRTLPLSEAERAARLAKYRAKMHALLGQYIEHKRGNYELPKARKNVRYSRMGHATWMLMSEVDTRFEDALDEEAEEAKLHAEIDSAYGDFDFLDDPSQYEEWVDEAAAYYLRDDEGGSPRERANRYKGRIPAPSRK